MNTGPLIGTYAVSCMVSFFAGSAIKLSRLVAAARRYAASGVCHIIPDVYPAPKPYPSSLRTILFAPVSHFHCRANLLWTAGYISYHIGILTLIGGYALSAALLAIRVLGHVGVPDVDTGVPGAASYTISNLLAIVFGNAERVQARFLFGSAASAFVIFSWVDLCCAVFGNMAMMITVLRRRAGSIRGNLDDAAAGIRTQGFFAADKLFVRSLILGIICCEILGRLELIKGVAHVHVVFGMTIIAIMPFTYLFHILYSPLAVYFAMQRRRRGRIA